MKYLLDTNIITELLKDDNEKVKIKCQEVKFQGEELAINGISYYEIKRGLLAIKAFAKLEKFETLFKQCNLVLLDTQRIFDIASEIYADLRQKGKPIGDADILIASIALQGNFILVTNDAHFNSINNLTIDNWL